MTERVQWAITEMQKFVGDRSCSDLDLPHVVRKDDPEGRCLVCGDEPQDQDLLPIVLAPRLL